MTDAFAERYFPYTPEELGNLDDAERWEAITVAGQGIIRTFYGGLIVVFALSESIVNLTFTIGLGLLLIGLLISLVFGWAAPVEHITANLARKICELILTSWGLSAIQGLLLAAIIDVATSGNAVATLGMGTLGLVMETAFALLAAKTIGGALIGVASAGSAGGVTEEHVQRGAQVVGGAALTAVSGGVAAVGGAGETALAYTAATRQGATRSYAAGYALSRSRTFARAGELAQAMGAVSPDSDVMQGLYTGHVMGRGDPLHLRSQKALGHDIGQRREYAEQQNQALGTLATVSLLRERQQVRQQEYAETQESRFVDHVQRTQARRQTAPLLDATTPSAPAARQEVEPLTPPTPQHPPIVFHQPPLLAPIPRLMQPTDQQPAIATATAELAAQLAAGRSTSSATPPHPVDGPGYLAALQAHAEVEAQPHHPFWHAREERVSAAGEPMVASTPAQKPIPSQVVVEHVTRRATAPGTVITPAVYTRTVTPEPAETRVADATAALHAQYQAQRTTTDSPPNGPLFVTRPRRRGPILTQTPPKEQS